MKKLLLMFVMLLGSVATMQAQSFDFSCETFEAVALIDFDTDEVADLTLNGFSLGNVPHPSGVGRLDTPYHYVINILLTENGPADANGYIAHPGTSTKVAIEREHDGVGEFNYFLIHGQGIIDIWSPQRDLQDSFAAAIIAANAAVSVARAQSTVPIEQGTN